MRNAWETLGPLRPEVAAATGLAPDVRVVCGAHDSNASLVPHLVAARAVHRDLDRNLGHHHGGRRQGRGSIPRPTCWPTSTCAASPVPTARFMGGREFAVLAGDAPAEADEADVAGVVASGVLALPAFSDQGGPFAGRKGAIEGEAPATPQSARGARDPLCGADDRASASSASRRRATSSSKAASPARRLSRPCSPASWPPGGS